MHSNDIVFWFFLIFAGAAVLATVALFTRQPLLIAYIVIGSILGPHGMALIDDTQLVSDVAEIGIIFLLFLLGLDMQPKNLTNLLKTTVSVGVISTVAFFGIGFVVAYAFGYPLVPSVLIGATCAFSSTIIGIKLLPTTVLHHRHTGELVVGILLFQDLLAIVLLLAIGGTLSLRHAATMGLALPLLIASSFVVVRYAVLPLMQKFDVFHEFMFLLTVGWCLTVAVAAQLAGLSLEIGAFVAGVTLASSPISQYIAESLRPLRDFFLVLFFFSVGAGFNTSVALQVLPEALLLAALLLLAKPTVFALTLQWAGEDRATGWEVGSRLGQTSEFSLLVAYLAATRGLIDDQGSHFIQAAAVVTFVLSSYSVVLRYPSPIAVSDRLRRD